MNRTILAILPFTAACITGVPENGPPQYDSVHDRLESVTTWLFVHDEASSGAVTARRHGDSGSVTSTTNLAIPRGYLRTRIDATGQLSIDQLEIEVAPFTMDRMFDTPTQVQDVRLRLAEPVRVAPAWRSADEATATMPTVFDLVSAIASDGGAAPPPTTQRLPPESVEVRLTGSGDHVEASLDIDAFGALWTWDGVEVTEVVLSLDAATAD